MNRHITRVVLFPGLLLFGFNYLWTGTLQATEELSLDSSAGKVPILVGLTATLPQLDSSLGKATWPTVGKGVPPRGAGPGLRFNTQRIFYVYSDKGASANHFAPSGWMGDYGDIEIDDASTETPADGKTCIKIHYSGLGSQGFDWAGMYWQEPIDNWGNKSGGYNLSCMKQLTFWARGAEGGELIDVFQVGGIQGAHPDSGLEQIGPVVLTKDWKRYRIDLTGADLSKVSGGFAWAVGRFDDSGPITFYLDEIRFEH